MDLHAKLVEAMKAKDDLVKDVLRVVLGEVSTRKARSGKEPRDEEVHATIRSMMARRGRRRVRLRGRSAVKAWLRRRSRVSRSGGLEQRLTHRLVGGRRGQSAGGGEERVEPAAGGEDDGQEGGDGAAGAEVLQAKFGAQQRRRMALDMGRGEGKLHGTQASGRA